MSNDALFPIPPVAEADPALAAAEPAAPTDPADTMSDAPAQTPGTVNAETMTTTDHSTPAEAPEAQISQPESSQPQNDEIAALSPEGEIAVEELPVISEAAAPTSADPAATTEDPAVSEPESSEPESSEPAAPESEPESSEPAAPEAATSAEAASPAGEPVLPSGVDPAMIAARMLEIVTELETIAASPDVDDAGKAPDDRALTERLRGLEETWRTLISSGVQEPELRARQAAARAAYAGSRSRRAEMRAVDRARSGETKRALLVEAFALAQLAQGTSLSQLAGRRVGDEEPAKPAKPAKPSAASASPEVDTESVESTEPEAIADDVVAAEASIADTTLAPDAEAAEDAAIEPVDATLADVSIADVVEDAQASDVVPVEGESEQPQDVTEPAALVEDPAEVAVADGPTEVDAPVAEVEAPVGEVEAPVAEAASEAEAAAEVESTPVPVTTSTVTIDITAIARRARELQAEWTAAGFAGREVENELQPLFRRYMQVVFDLSRKESSGKSDARRALVTAARELADQAGDDVTNDAISRLVRDAKNLQTQWKNGEAAPPAVESGAWRQFSGALRQVFAARERLSAGAKVEREAIIASVTALASAKEPMRAMRDLGPLLRRWRESGPVTTPVYEALKLQLDRAAATVRERADSERKRRDAEDAKSQGERAKNASKILREAERSGRGKRQERPAAQAQAQGALAAALAEAFGRAERVAEDVRGLERTVADVRARLQLAESGSLESTTEEVENEQGFTVRRQTIDPGSVNPARLRAELAQAEQALGRRQAELQELTSNARGFGISS